MTYRKKLIEVALPLEAINAACKRDKDRKTGTIRNLHKWFAPMPSPAWRAVIAASLIDDPGNEADRQELFDLIQLLVASDAKPPPRDVVSKVRQLIRDSVPDLPIVMDPFCGGGSTLLEAQRLGLDAVGSDLNPIPVLITRMLTTVGPQLVGRPGITQKQRPLTELTSGLEGFAIDISNLARRVRDEAKNQLERFYPQGPNGDPIIGWWWARTIASPDPRFAGAHTPLVNSWWLDKRKGSETYLRPLVADTKEHTVSYEVVNGTGPAPEGSKSTCLLSETPISFDYIKKAGLANELGTTLLALVTQGDQGRHHFAATQEHAALAHAATPRDPPRLTMPAKALGFTVQQYGITEWAQLFTPRQMLALETFAEVVSQVRSWAIELGAESEYADALTTFLGLCVGKLAQACSMQVRWNVRNGPAAKAEPAFSRPDISPLWDFFEVNPFGGSVGDWLQIVETALRSLEYVNSGASPARVFQRDARHAHSLVKANSALIATDPPYFSNFGYADPSEYFYIWLRKALKDVHPDLFATLGAPRSGELIADPTRHQDDKHAARSYFIDGLRQTFEGLRQAARADLPMLVVYAFRQQESVADGIASTGWEAVLEALIGAGLSVVGTWPIHGARGARARGVASNALMTYVLLVCRVRPADAPMSTRQDFHRQLRGELKTSIQDLTAAAIPPVDLAQALVGPGMAIYSNFSRVVDADGKPMGVRDALTLINRTLDEVFEEQEADLDAETRWAVAWFTQYGMQDGPYGVADSLSRAKNTAVNALEEAGIVKARAGKVRLLGREELDPNWDPASDNRLTIWEIVQHLVQLLEKKGESTAAALLRRVGSLGDTARELSYRLYSTAERKNWSREALAYNDLVLAWPELARQASAQPGQQQTFDS